MLSVYALSTYGVPFRTNTNATATRRHLGGCQKLIKVRVRLPSSVRVVCSFKSLSVAKFGGSLLDVEGKGIPKIVNRIREIREKDGFGPIVVFSAPMGFTDALIRIGESCAQSAPLPVEEIFEVYIRLAKSHVKGEWLKPALEELANYKALVQTTLDSVNKRFSGNIKARILTFGGELAMSTLADYILKSNGLDSCHMTLEEWPIVTDDNFEDAVPNYGLSKKRIHTLMEPLEDGKILCFAGFLRRNVRRA